MILFCSKNGIPESATLLRDIGVANYPIKKMFSRACWGHSMSSDFNI